MRDDGHIQTDAVGTLLTVMECAERLKVKKATAYRIFATEPGVHRIFTPRSKKKPILRVPETVLDRVLQRSAVKSVESVAQ